MNEYRRLTIQVLAGEQPKMKEIIEDHLESDIDDLTIKLITTYIRECINEFNDYIV